jgi:hypothetical protein
LVVIVFICALGLGGFMAGVRRNQARRAAIAAVYASGGVAAYNYQWMPGGRDAKRILWEPSRLREVIGNVAFLGVIHVCWSGHYPASGGILPAAVTDDQAAVLRAFPRLGRVRIDDAPGITDKTLAHLAGASGLWELSLARVNITDGGLANLKGVKKLESLGLTGVPSTDRGLLHLAGLNIEYLFLNNCPIDGSGPTTG